MIQNCPSNPFLPQNVDSILISFHFFGQQFFIAVIKIDNTATVKTIFPQESPIAKGTPNNKITETRPVLAIKDTSIVAPTRTNKTISAPTHNLFSFSYKRIDTCFLSLCNAIPIVITEIKAANGIYIETEDSNATNIKKLVF